jgi:hypothetical protein
VIQALNSMAVAVRAAMGAAVTAVVRRPTGLAVFIAVSNSGFSSSMSAPCHRPPE